jgi:cytochrome c
VRTGSSMHPWRVAAMAALLMGSVGDMKADEVAAGERLFRGQCMGCHSVEPDYHRAGPTLHGLFGRRSGELPGFDYSPAMVEAEIVWDPETLDAFLADPSGLVPGTRMVFWGLHPDQRRQIIAYLKDATR